jgi:hypothetical protein
VDISEIAYRDVGEDKSKSNIFDSEAFDEVVEERTKT